MFVGVEDKVFEKVLSKQGLPYRTISSGALHGGGWRGRLRSVRRIGRGIGEARKILREFAPDALLGMGGFAQVPTFLAARLAGIPSALHEQNATAGRANLLLSRLAARVFVSHDSAVNQFPKGRALFTGLPVRRSFFEYPSPVPHHPSPFTLFVLGGSQGAYFLNRLMADVLPKLGSLAARFRFIHQTGEGDYSFVADAYRAAGVRAETAPFFHDVDRRLRETHLVLARAGASSVAEFSAAGRGAVLVPYPFAVKDHQFANARALESAGGAQVFRQSEMTADKMANILAYFLEKPEKAVEMGTNAAKLARPDAAKRVCEELEKLCLN